MSLGLFNWTSNLSDEPEYPPFFDNLKISVSGRTSPRVMRNEECIIWIDGGGEFDSTEIGVIEFNAYDPWKDFEGNERLAVSSMWLMIYDSDSNLLLRKYQMVFI